MVADFCPSTSFRWATIRSVAALPKSHFQELLSVCLSKSYFITQPHYSKIK